MSDEVKPWDLLNPKEPRSALEVQEERFNICKSCEWFRQSSHTCRKCGCFMKLKTMLENASCPIGKW